MEPHRRDVMRPPLAAKGKQFKASYERIIMGEEVYEKLYANGIKEPKSSLWHWVYDLL